MYTIRGISQVYSCNYGKNYNFQRHGYIGKAYIIYQEIPGITCGVPQLMSVLLTEFLSALDIFSVFIEIDFVHID